MPAINRQTKVKAIWFAVGVAACVFAPANMNPAVMLAKALGKVK